MNNILQTLDDQKDRGVLSVTPQDIFELDNIEFSNYQQLNRAVELIVHSKLDLITVLHFSDLPEKNTTIFFKNAHIDTQDLPHPSHDQSSTFINNLKARISYEAGEESSVLLDAYNDKKQHKLNFDAYKLDNAKKQEKQVPRKEEEQKSYLLGLIEQGFFNVVDNYNNWQDRLASLFYQLSQFNSLGSYQSAYQKWYRNRVIIEAYKRNKLSNIGLQLLVNIRMDSSHFDTYESDIVKFAYSLRLAYPELSQKIIESISFYMKTSPKRYNETDDNINTWKLVSGRGESE